MRTTGYPKPLHIHWDPMIDGDFRRRFEEALAGLDVAAVDAEAVDRDPEEAAPVTLVMASAAGPYRNSGGDIVVLAGRANGSAPQGALRLEASDIKDRSRRWDMLVERLRVKLGRESLGLAPEDLRLKLDEMTERLNEAERARAAFERRWNEAVRERDKAKNDLASAHADINALWADIAAMKDELDRFELLAEEFRFMLPASLTTEDRDAAMMARDHLWRARLAAAKADACAEARADQLSWPQAGVSYAGETKDGKPDGHGVLTFSEAGRVVSTYRGAFRDGRRNGHGVGAEDDGHVWSGEWRDGEAIGHGCLITPNGGRFEGETIAGPDGAPRRLAGCMWPAAFSPEKNRRRATRQPRSLRLPAPDQPALVE